MTEDHEEVRTELPLSNLKVLDLASLYAGPWIATYLADFGADVLKVEHPRGDNSRSWGLKKDGIPLWWKVISRNKSLLSLDLNVERDRALVRRLVEEADVLIENFRPGRMERWGLGYEDLSAINPRLIMVRVTGYGQTGPMATEPGFGTLAEAFSGFAYMTGQEDGPPTLPPFGLADGVAAAVGVGACLTALYWRDLRGGTGQMIDLTLYEPLFSILGPQVTEYTQTGVVQRRAGNRSPRTSPRNAYETLDADWVVLSAGTQQIADRVFRAVGRGEFCTDEKYSTPEGRRHNADEIDSIVADWIGAHETEEVLAAFRSEQAPISVIYSTDQIVLDEQFRARQTIVTLPDSDLGEVTMQNVVPKLSRTPGRIRWAGQSAIGAGTERIRDWIGDDYDDFCSTASPDPETEGQDG